MKPNSGAQESRSPKASKASKATPRGPWLGASMRCMQVCELRITIPSGQDVRKGRCIKSLRESCIERAMGLCERSWASTFIATLYTVPGLSASPNEAMNGLSNSGNIACGSLTLPNFGDLTQATEWSTNTVVIIGCRSASLHKYLTPSYESPASACFYKSRLQSCSRF